MDQINAYPTIPVTPGDVATVDADGDNQTCACGNDSQAADWAAADANGIITFQATASTDEREHAVCPACGRVYRNADLFIADLIPAPVITRYDTKSPTYATAIARYNHDAYGASEQDVES